MLFSICVPQKATSQHTQDWTPPAQLERTPTGNHCIDSRDNTPPSHKNVRNRVNHCRTAEVQMLAADAPKIARPLGGPRASGLLPRC